MNFTAGSPLAEAAADIALAVAATTGVSFAAPCNPADDMAADPSAACVLNSVGQPVLLLLLLPPVLLLLSVKYDPLSHGSTDM